MRALIMALFACTLFACGGGGGGGGGEQPQPVPEKKAGVLVFVHGGGWTMSPPVLPAPSTAGLPELAAEIGFDYAAITYPLSTANYHSFPDAHRSVADQLRAMRSQYQRVYAVGSSAGANLVALVALESPDAVDKVALFYGVYDLPAMDAEFNALYSDLYAADLYSASPAHIGHIKIPHHLWHGTGDQLVPYSQSTGYDDEHTTLVEGAPHGFVLAELAGKELKRFLICSSGDDCSN